MASLREIRRKIKSDKSVQQITKAMKVVAASRLRRAQSRIQAARPFAQKMEEMMGNLWAASPDMARHPLFATRPSDRRILLVVTSDKGLCGAFNTNLIRKAVRYLSEHGSEKVSLFVVGKKGRDRFSRQPSGITKDYVNIFNTLSYVHSDVIVSDLLDAYRDGRIAGVDMIYSEFQSLVKQQAVLKPLLPLGRISSAPKEDKPTTARANFLFEPERDALVDALIPRYLKAQVYRVLLESNASELASRMVAMDNATRNAAELIASLTLMMNRTRQASITNEIMEVVGGAEALR